MRATFLTSELFNELPLLFLLFFFFWVLFVFKESRWKCGYNFGIIACNPLVTEE